MTWLKHLPYYLACLSIAGFWSWWVVRVNLVDDPKGVFVFISFFYAVLYSVKTYPTGSNPKDDFIEVLRQRNLL